jgi:outer membrane lipoprotein SlyB
MGWAGIRTWVLASALFLSSCTNYPEQSVYRANELGEGRTTFAEILSSREIEIERMGAEDESANSFAIFAGAMVGLAVAVLTGTGSLAELATATVGGSAGYIISETNDSARGYEYVLRDEYDQLQTIVVAAGDAEMIEAGRSVAVIESAGGVTRLVEMEKPPPVPGSEIEEAPWVEPGAAAQGSAPPDDWENPDDWSDSNPAQQQ